MVVLERLPIMSAELQKMRIRVYMHCIKDIEIAEMCSALTHEQGTPPSKLTEMLSCSYRYYTCLGLLSSCKFTVMLPLQIANIVVPNLATKALCSCILSMSDLFSSGTS